MADNFDPDKYLAEAPAQESTFDPDAYLADSKSTAAPVAEQKESAIPAEVKAPIGGALGGAAGYGAGKAANYLGQELIANPTNYILDNIGKLSPEQMSHIQNNAAGYRSAPALSDAMNEVRDLGAATRQKGFDSAAAAKASLAGAEDIPVEEYFKTLSETAKSPKYSSEIAPGVQQSIQEQRMSQVRPAIEAKASNAANLENKLAQISGQEFVDPNASKIAELEQLLAQPKADPAKQVKQAAQNKLQDRRLQRIDEDLAISPNSRKLNNKKEDFLFSKSVNTDKAKKVDTIKETAKLEAMQKELAELREAQKTGTAAQAAKKAEQIAKIEASKAKVESDIANKAGSAKTKADADFNKNVLRTPEEIRNVDPEFFNKRTFDPDFAKSLDRAVSKGRNVEKISPTRLAEGILPSLRDSADFSPTGASSVDKFNTDISEDVRKYLGNKFSEYDAGMKSSADAIGSEEKFKKFGVGFDEKAGTVAFPEGQRNKLASQIISGADSNIDEKALFQSLAGDLHSQQLLKQDPQAFLANLKNSALKDAVKNTDQLKLSGYDAVNTATSPTGAVKPFLDSKATKIQEMAALSRADGLLNTGAKAAKGLGSALPGILGVGGAILGATSAAQAGELTPGEATAAGAIDAINPLPLDAVQGAVQGKKGYNDSINDQKATEEYFNGGDVSSSQAIAAGAIGAAKGLVQPAVDLGNAIGEQGTQASTDARSRMEQNMSAGASLNASTSGKYTTPVQPKNAGAAAAPKNDFLDFVDKNPEALNQLAEQLSANPAGASYAGPLQKAAEADGRTRSAILFGLYQQPAFRSLIGGESTMISKNIPGVKKTQE